MPCSDGRIHEQSIRKIPELVTAIVENLIPWIDRPYALFGHSLGGLIAFEVANAVRRAGVLPAHSICLCRPLTRRSCRGPTNRSLT